MTATATRPGLVLRYSIDALIGIFIVVASLIPDTIAPGGFQAPDDFDLVAGAAAVIMAVSLFGRRRWPVPVFGIVLAISVAVTATGHSSLGCVIAVGVSVFEIARTGQRVSAIGAASASILILGTILVTRSHETLPRVIGVLAVIGFAAAAGDALHSRRALIDSITERARRAEETKEEEAQRRVIQERLRIARELHDAAAHQIAVINLQAGAATAAFAGNRREDTERALGNIRASARNVLSEIAAMLVVLRSDDEAGQTNLPPVRGMADLPSMLDEFEQAGLRVTGSHDDVPHELPGAVDVVAYKAIHEALTNAHKHGADAEAQLDIRAGDRDLFIHISNHRPAEPQRPEIPSGHGLTGIRERVASVHGEIDVSGDADTFTLDIRLPLDLESRP